MQDEFDDEAMATREWTDAITSVIAFEGTERADHVLGKVVETARRAGARVPFAANTAYMNSISVAEEPKHPGNREIEHRIRSVIRWNAAAIVLRANKVSSELGGHIASFQSAATLYDTGFMHFWHAPTENHGGDLVFVQGHSSPGIYARLPRGSAHGGAAPELPPGGRRQGSLVLSTPGSCPTSGSSRRCRWGSGRSWPSTRRGS